MSEPIRKFVLGDTEIIPVEYGNSVFSERYIFEGGDPEKMHPIVFMVYLIKSCGKLILVDAGCETMPGFDMKNFIGPIAALQKIGVNAEDIDDLLITHAHHDHIECTKCFENARVYIQKDEYEDGKRYFSEKTRLCVFENEAKACEKVKIVKIGGHSKGSCAVEIEDGGKKYVIAGDELYLRECITQKRLPGEPHCREASRAFFEKYVESGEYEVLLCHDK